MNRNKKSLYQWCIENNKEYFLNEWNYDKNDLLGIDVNEITTGSNKKVWWKCSKGHEWMNIVYKRIRFESLCPICNGRRLLPGVNDLCSTNPELTEEWDYEKNGDLKPSDVTRISRKRVYWICKKCGHKWSIPVFSRAVNGDGCIECSKKIRGENKHKTSLKTHGYLSNKKVLKDWDCEANFPLTPKDFTPLSGKYAYWKCHICGYKWKATVHNRVNGRGCPLCNNKVVIKGKNDLTTTHPEIAKEWHPTKNGNLKPDMITYGYGKKVYWLCPKGHEYQATVNHRTAINGTKCPICNVGRQSSFAEQALYFYIKKEYPDALNRYKPEFLERMELDIYIPSINTAIEYDGAPWHKKDKLSSEQKKYRLCNENGIKLIRVREQFADLGSEVADIQFGNNKKLYEKKNLENVIIQVIQHLTFKLLSQIDVCIKRDEIEILKYSREIDNINFESEYPEKSKEWHPTKNGSLKPNMFKPHSDHKVWWICPKCKNEYKMSFDLRSRGSGCPICGAKKAHDSKCISIEMLDPSTNEVIKTFASIREASNEMKINESNISMVCKGNTSRVKAGGYKWKYKNKQ